MSISWKHLGIVAGVVVTMVASQPTDAKKGLPEGDIHPCGKCSEADVCGTADQVPKMCGPTKQGPWTGNVTYACCCCVEGGRNNWFWGG